MVDSTDVLRCLLSHTTRPMGWHAFYVSHSSKGWAQPQKSRWVSNQAPGTSSIACLHCTLLPPCCTRCSLPHMLFPPSCTAPSLSRCSLRHTLLLHSHPPPWRALTQDGGMMLINGKYVVVKHLGTGTFGQVKLAFNLDDNKLYAIKACRKSQLGCPLSVARGRRCARSRAVSHRRTRGSS
eukprot:361448-Chlamydomonas_euryale.AAC.2